MEAAQIRLTDTCMDEHDFEFVLTNSSFGDEEMVIRAYVANDADEQRELDLVLEQCAQRVAQALGIGTPEPLTRDDYLALVAYHRCLTDDAGLPLGPVVSEAAWMASNGQLPPADNWEEVLAAGIPDDAVEAFSACDRQYAGL